jgi:hypothetical protein
MKLDGYTILHRKDEHGVIVESGVFGPDDEVPEGFGPATFEVVKNEARLASVEESKLTPWKSPVVYQGIEEQPDDALNDAVADESDEDDEDDEDDQLNEGSPVQARVEGGGELTEAEQEAFDALESDDESGASGGEAPPKGGPGSGRDAWAAYAEANDVDVTDEMNRDDIIAACEAKGVATV